MLTTNTLNSQDGLAPPDKQAAALQLPTVVSKKIGWAIVGLGKLALEEIMPAFAQSKYSKPVALVSGHADKAKQVAAAYSIDPRHIYDYNTFDRLADNPAVEVIYIVLPNSMHAEYTIRGFKARKHVLCEKPMAVNTKECESMIAAGREAQRKLMIAYRLHYEPFHHKVMSLCRDKKLGALKTIATSNCQNVKAPNIRLSSKLGGGPVGDVGIYCLNAARYFSGQEPVEVTASEYQPQNDPRFKEVPESVSFTLRFPSGLLAQCDCSFGTEESRRCVVHCGEGVIDLDRAYGYRGQQLMINKAEEERKLDIEPVNHFAAEMDHFSQCVLNNKPPQTPGEEGLADMKVIEAIYRSCKTRKTEAV